MLDSDDGVVDWWRLERMRARCGVGAARERRVGIASRIIIVSSVRLLCCNSQVGIVRNTMSNVGYESQEAVRGQDRRPKLGRDARVRDDNDDEYNQTILPLPNYKMYKLNVALFFHFGSIASYLYTQVMIPIHKQCALGLSFMRPTY